MVSSPDSPTAEAFMELGAALVREVAKGERAPKNAVRRVALCQLVLVFLQHVYRQCCSSPCGWLCMVRVAAVLLDAQQRQAFAAVGLRAFGSSWQESQCYSAWCKDEMRCLSCWLDGRHAILEFYISGSHRCKA